MGKTASKEYLVGNSANIIYFVGYSASKNHLVGETASKEYLVSNSAKIIYLVGKSANK